MEHTCVWKITAVRRPDAAPPGAGFLAAVSSLVTRVLQRCEVCGSLKETALSRDWTEAEIRAAVLSPDDRRQP